MWVAERHRLILDLLQTHQRLTTEHFAEALGVSRETVRRDLIELERSGHLARVHGGAVPPAAAPAVPPEPAYLERTGLQQPQKREIARLAATLIQPGQACFLDAGSTTLALAQELAQREGLIVITNSLDAAMVLACHRRHEVHLLGGRLEDDVPATYGEQTVAEIARLQVDWALVSPVGIDAANGAMDYLWHEATVARAMLGRARQRVVLADASKLGQASRVQICPPAEVDVLVTDGGADAAQLERLTAAGVKRVLQPEAVQRPTDSCAAAA
ncbi:DeoR/GlpR family DNA-binding transcription regulator [Roseateles saccharophilus]|uniref:DeoR family transcriptional regulator n=1 Tax=Roseateles saccharophilus TaxID=304 RepID=A0A4R3VJY4_ROSSA|nr:DeoR/GlpR family DNA-binding transcription regulator [Roseateles saccharophilus]MDG0831363.1 DeoR/GlpR transcriptional regulator [Roseateles saccharophilus]TCV04493.1 DeoR family transcriptional regulator [Roseateles saccharophilus]